MGKKIRCLKCNTELESKHRHDFRMCKCDNQTFIDGGNDYFRYGCMNNNLVKWFNPKTNTWEKFKNFEKNS